MEAPSSPDSRRSNRILWLVVIGGIAALCIGIFLTRQRAPEPDSGPLYPTIASRFQPETAPGDRGAPERRQDNSARSPERQQQLANDPERIAAAERALAGFERLFLDASALEAVGAGDIRGGTQPRPLSNREMALAAIDSVIAQPENAGAIRARSLLVLDSLLRQPWPTLVTPEADQFVLQERGQALALLIGADPAAAAAAFQGIPDDAVRERVAVRAVHLLVTGGMEPNNARARVASLSRP